MKISLIYILSFFVMSAGCKAKKKNPSLATPSVCQKFNSENNCETTETNMPAVSAVSAAVFISNGLGGAKIAFDLKFMKDGVLQSVILQETSKDGNGDGHAFATIRKNSGAFEAGSYRIDVTYSDANTTQNSSVDFQIGTGAPNTPVNIPITNQNSEAITLTFSPHQPDPRISSGIEKSAAFTALKNLLNKELNIPTIPAEFKTCGKINSWYDRGTKRITMCYEWFLRLFDVLKANQTGSEAAIDSINVFAFTLAHEFGHGIIHQHNLPVTGGGEDAADEFASLVLIADGKAGVVFDAAKFFLLSGNKSNTTLHTFFNEHGPSQVRAGNMFCMVYGSDQNKFKPLVTKGLVLSSRAQKCIVDFKARVQAWKTILKPFSK